jgi:hypothetical protein
MRKGNGGGKGGEEERWGGGREIMRYIYKQMKIEETSRDSKNNFFGNKFIGIASYTALQRRESNRCPCAGVLLLTCSIAHLLLC